MFTGIIEETGHIRSVKKMQNGLHITIEANSVLEGTVIGDSISVDGVCQTVESLQNKSFTVFTSQITSGISTLSQKSPGDCVNLERALTPEKRMGGHIVQGHVDGVGTITAINKLPNGHQYRITCQPSEIRYLVTRGSVCVDGISLTVVETFANGFLIYLIPESIKNTSLAVKKSGDMVNIEVDIIAKYIEKMAGLEKKEGMQEKLERNGFLN
ncbi:MAG: riboflavin synthase [Spirochaetes bacterium]|jgi:riboflavin synthase|nr:riboflavin synthase [Spirochaetota bacterium]